GARALVGGRRLDRPGFFFAPTVLVDVDHTMRVMREETFGPLIGLARVGSDDEAVALMNDTDYGLTAAVYTPDRARAERLLARVNTGTAYWNCCDRVSPRLPWTGRGASGLGVTLAREGIAAFVRPKAWHLRATRDHVSGRDGGENAGRWRGRTACRGRRSRRGRLSGARPMTGNGASAGGG